MKLPNCTPRDNKSKPNEIRSIKISIKEQKAIFQTWKMNSFETKSEEESRQAIKLL